MDKNDGGEGKQVRGRLILASGDCEMGVIVTECGGDDVPICFVSSVHGTERRDEF